MFQKQLTKTYTLFFKRKLHEETLNIKQRKAIYIYLTRLNKLLISAQLRYF